MCVFLSIGFEGDFIKGKLKAKVCYCQRQADALWSCHAQECFKNVSNIYLSFCVCVLGGLPSKQTRYSVNTASFFDGILEAQVNLGSAPV